MRLTVFSAGSRGDIQPYLALALGLKKSGLDVTFAANINFAGLAAARGLAFEPIHIDSYQITQTREAQAWLDSGSTLKLAIHTIRVIRPVLDRLIRETFEIVRSSDAVIYHSFTLPFIHSFAGYLGIPVLPASLYPLPTRSHPALPLNIHRSPGRWFNLLSHFVVDHFAWQIFYPRLRRFLRGKTRPSLFNPYWDFRKNRTPVICGYSPTLVPRPSDLAAHVDITGFWFLDSAPGWQPDAALAAFLDAGSPPIFAGFGSMGNPAKNEETARIILDAARSADQRVILGGGWSGLQHRGALPEHAHQVGSIPYEWLFPRMAAVVHHGGAGTTSLGLRAGVPAISVPHFSDNFFWSRQAYSLGVGPAPIPRRNLSVGKLAGAMTTAAENPAMRKRAEQVGRQIRNEDGLARAIQNIRETFGV